MKKTVLTVLVLTLGLMVFAGSAYADGDLVVTGKMAVGTEPSQYSLVTVGSTTSNNDSKTAGTFSTTQTGDYNAVGIAGSARRNYSAGDSRAGATGISGMALANQTGNLTRVHPYAALNGMAAEVAYNFSSDKDATITNAVGMTSVHRIRGNWNGTETLTVTNMTGYRSVGFDSNYTPMAGDTINITKLTHFRAYDSITNTGAGTVNMTEQIGLYIEPMSAATNNYGIVLAGDGAGSDIVFGTNKNVRIYSQSGRLWAEDSAFNKTVLSPHDPETGEWIYYSKNVKTGEVVRVDMEKLVSLVEKLTGETLMVKTIEEVK